MNQYLFILGLGALLMGAMAQTITNESQHELPRGL